MRKYLHLLIIAGVLVITAIACQKETSKTTKDNEFNTAEAKEWWYGSYRKSAEYKEINWSSIFAPSPGSSTKKYPNWNKAIGYKKFSFEIVEIPLFYQTNEILLPGMQHLNKTKEGERVARTSTHKLLLIKGTNGKIFVRTVTIVPTAGYAAKNNYDISNVHPNSLPPDFEGYLMIAGWDETEKNTVKIEKGKPVRKVKLLTREQMVKIGTKANRTEALVCPDAVWVSRMRFVCVVVPTGDALADQAACEANGDWVDYGGYEYPPCYDEEDPNDPNGPGELNDCLNSGMSTEECFCILYNAGCEEGGSGNEPPPLIENNVINPCIYASTQNAIALDCRNKISSFINTIYGSSEVNHLDFRDGVLQGSSSGDDAYTVTGSILNGTETKTTITFNNSQLNNSTREYIAATILHEAVHAWIDYQYISPVEAAQQHNLMASTNRFNMMLAALLELFPTMSPQDASDLTWGGLYNTPLFENKPLLEKQRIVNKNLDYKNHTANTGTPC